MKNIAVIGAGIAGLEASRNLALLGYNVTLFEKETYTGGHVKQWHKLFPDLKNSEDVINALQISDIQNITLYTSIEIKSIEKQNDRFCLKAETGKEFNADAVLLTTGFDLFDAHKKEEYGYGIYDHVITSADLEYVFNSGKTLTERLGHVPERVGFVHCVGSRDEKTGNIYCSKVCCVTAVKQAMEIKEMYPDAEVFCFYMDLRMFGRYYEEIYKEAQEKYNLQFIRGRLSEAAENKEGKVIVKVEDTLLGKPLKISVDLLVLMSGMVAPKSTQKLRDGLGLVKEEDGFLKPVDTHSKSNISEIPGIFMAGSCTGPKTITDTLADACSVSFSIHQYFNQNKGL